MKPPTAGRGRRWVTGALGFGCLLFGAASGAAQHVPSEAELVVRGLMSTPTGAVSLASQGFQAGQHPDPNARARAIASGWSVGLADRAAAPPRSTGTLRVLVIAALFADSEEPAFSSDDLQAAMFEGPSSRGTVTELYDEASGGLLQMVGTVTPWIRTSKTVAEVRGGELNEGEPPQRGVYMLEAVAAADAMFDLGEFDNDGPDGVPNSGDDDGFIDSLFFLYAEVGLHCGGLGPWPHFGGLSPWNDGEPYRSDEDRTPGGEPIKVDPYVMTTAVDCAGETIGAVGVAAHELGHVLGLPDIYDPVEGSLAVQRRWVLGCWELMAAGAWGCGAADEVSGHFGPTGFSPWTKDRLGWVGMSTVVDAVNQEFVLEPIQTSGVGLRVPMDDQGFEYYLVEYRPKEGFDELLPAGGVLIYHVDENGSFRPTRDSTTNAYVVSMVEADANNTLQRTHTQGGNRGEAGDAWAAAGAEAAFSTNTSPATLLSSGEPSGVRFHSIRVVDDLARLVISTRDALLDIAQERLLAPFLGTITAPLTGEELELLDRDGNGNGVYDVGDLRARVLGG